jgi:cellulase/cellobiase CelA1
MTSRNRATLLRLCAPALVYLPLLLLTTSAASAATITFSETADWGAGEDGQITIDNTGGAAIGNWLLQFNFTGAITSISDAAITSHSGNLYQVEGLSYDDTVPANGELSFGFSASPGGGIAPSNMFLVLPPVYHVTFEDTADWGSGENGQITIDNPGTSAITNWSLQFNFPGVIVSIWNASVTSHQGSVYGVTNLGYNSTIPGNGSASFGFEAAPGSTAASNFVLGGALQTPVSTPEPSSVWLMGCVLGVVVRISRMKH